MSFNDQFPGVADFEGITVHSAVWDQDLDLSDKKVAVIGTGASSVQGSFSLIVVRTLIIRKRRIW